MTIRWSLWRPVTSLKKPDFGSTKRLPEMKRRRFSRRRRGDHAALHRCGDAGRDGRLRSGAVHGRTLAERGDRRGERSRVSDARQYAGQCHLYRQAFQRSDRDRSSAIDASGRETACPAASRGLAASKVARPGCTSPTLRTSLPRASAQHPFHPNLAVWSRTQFLR
jgi:hypothetical protein